MWLHKRFGPTCEIWDDVRFTFEPASGDSMSLLTKQIVSNEVPPFQKKRRKKKSCHCRCTFFAFPHHCFFKVYQELEGLIYNICIYCKRISLIPFTLKSLCLHVCSVKKDNKPISNTLLRLVSFFTERSFDVSDKDFQTIFYHCS